MAGSLDCEWSTRKLNTASLALSSLAPEIYGHLTPPQLQMCFGFSSPCRLPPPALHKACTSKAYAALPLVTSHNRAYDPHTRYSVTAIWFQKSEFLDYMPCSDISRTRTLLESWTPILFHCGGSFQSRRRTDNRICPFKFSN